MTRQISVEEAREFFEHPSQWRSARPEQLPESGFAYYASGPICGVFHDMPWPKVIGAHCGVKQEGWGKIVPHAKEILAMVWSDFQPDVIVAWTPESNRPTLAFNRRVGFIVDGYLPTPERTVMQSWRPKCQ